MSKMTLFYAFWLRLSPELSLSNKNVDAIKDPTRLRLISPLLRPRKRYCSQSEPVQIL